MNYKVKGEVKSRKLSIDPLCFYHRDTSPHHSRDQAGLTGAFARRTGNGEDVKFQKRIPESDKITNVAKCTY